MKKAEILEELEDVKTKSEEIYNILRWIHNAGVLEVEESRALADDLDIALREAIKELEAKK